MTEGAGFELAVPRQTGSGFENLPVSASEGLTIMVNSIYNDWHFEDVWLDK